MIIPLSSPSAQANIPAVLVSPSKIVVVHKNQADGLSRIITASPIQGDPQNIVLPTTSDIEVVSSNYITHSLSNAISTPPIVQGEIWIYAEAGGTASIGTISMTAPPTEGKTITLGLAGHTRTYTYRHPHYVGVSMLPIIKTTLHGQYIDVAVQNANRSVQYIYRRFWFNTMGTTVGQPAQGSAHGLHEIVINAPADPGDPLNGIPAQLDSEVVISSSTLSSALNGAFLQFLSNTYATVEGNIYQKDVGEGLFPHTFNICATYIGNIEITSPTISERIRISEFAPPPSNTANVVIINPYSISTSLSNLYNALTTSPGEVSKTYGGGTASHDIFSFEWKNNSIVMKDLIKTKRQRAYITESNHTQTNILTPFGGISGQLLYVIKVGESNSVGNLSIGKNDTLAETLPRNAQFESQWYRISSRPCTLYVKTGISPLPFPLQLWYEAATDLGTPLTIYRGLGMPSTNNNRYLIQSNSTNTIQFHESCMEYIRVSIYNPNDTNVAVCAKLAIT